jgi:pilus assembly protein CpaC
MNMGAALNRFLVTLVIVASVVVAAVPAGAATALSMRTGTSQILHLANIRQIAIGDPSILGALPLAGKTEILINAKQPGSTTLFVWTSGGAERAYQITVTASDLDLLVAMLRSTLNRPDVTVETFGHSVVLRGTVPDGSALQQVADVIERFAPVAKQDNATVVNAVMIAQPLGSLQTGDKSPYMANVRVDPDGRGNVIVSGRVLNEAQRQAVLNNVRGMAGRYLSANGQILDRLAMTLTTQVDVKVYVLEVDDTGQSTLGLRLQSATLTTTDVHGNPLPTLGTPTFPIVESKPNPFNPFSIGPFFRTTVLAPTLDLEMQEGHTKILSEPDLMTVPGQDATFLVGGQVPVPQSAGLGQVSVTFQSYGVQLDITPTLMGNGDVATKIISEVSDLDFSNGLQANGFTVPALKTSRIATNVVTAPGESIIIGGMLRHVEQRTITEIPLLSRLPIIGRLFRDVNYQRQHTNIIFLVTPTVITR